MTIQDVFLALAVLLYILKSLDLLYVFQTKEYRFDRFMAAVKEEGLFSIFYTRSLRLPAKTVRNGVIAFLIVTFGLILFLLIEHLTILLFLVFFALLPFFSTVPVFLGVLCTFIPVTLHRRVIISRAAQKILQSKAIVIGITGSYGKTSVKEYLYQILSAKYKVAKTDENQNTDVGVALSVLKNLKSDTQFFIAEMGAYRVGEIKKICSFMHPKYGILTGIGNQHLSLFGSKEKLLATKLELLQSLPAGGAAYINKDIDEWKEIDKKIKVKKYFYSVKVQADIYAKHLSTSEKGSTAEVTYKTSTIEIGSNLEGEHTVLNLLPCIGLAFDLDIDKETLISLIKKLTPVSRRLEIIKTKEGSTVINDSYNSNLDGFLSALKAISKMRGRKIIVTKGLIELGSEKEKSYKKILQSIFKNEIELFTTDKLFAKLDSVGKVRLFKNEKKILDALVFVKDKNTAILIEGKFPKEFIYLITSR